ncbi:MAG: hypothetical protein ACKOW2_06010, partial [Sphingobacteriaceae bacterium]
MKFELKHLFWAFKHAVRCIFLALNAKKDAAPIVNAANRNTPNYAGCLAMLLVLTFMAPLAIQAQQKKDYKIALIDLMLLKRQKVGAISLAAELKADGLEIDMGGLGSRETFDNKLQNDSIRQEYLNKAKALNIEFCAIAMTGFYAQS